MGFHYPAAGQDSSWPDAGVWYPESAIHWRYIQWSTPRFVIDRVRMRLTNVEYSENPGLVFSEAIMKCALIYVGTGALIAERTLRKSWGVTPGWTEFGTMPASGITVKLKTAIAVRGTDGAWWGIGFPTGETVDWTATIQYQY